MYEQEHKRKRPVPLSLAARYCRVKPSWLKAEAEAGRLPGLNAGDRWLFDLPQLEHALAERVRMEGGAK